jgi:hypothetical protein
MTTMTRSAALCGVLALLFTAACGDSPTQPSALPATVTIAANQTATIEGTNLRITVDAPPYPCNDTASCIAWYGSRLILRIDDGPAAELAVPLDGRPAQQRIGRYTVSFVGFVWDPARIKVLVEGS